MLKSYLHYIAKVFDRIETNSAYSMHENLNTDINQEGLENEISMTKSNEKIQIYSNFSKSRKDNGQAQARRPDIVYGMNYSKQIKYSPIGNYYLNLSYKHTGKYVDYNGSINTKQKETDIFDLSLNKKFQNKILYIDLKNLTNERFEKPATYSQNGREIFIKLTSKM